MDPVSHLLFARMLSALREEARTARAVVAATTLGGIAPDVDALLMSRGWDVYLRYHEGGTHALVGTFLTAVLTAAVVRRVAREAPWGPLIAGAWIGTLSHVFFDLVSGASVQPLWPLSTMRVTAPIVAMADPLAIACLLAGAAALYIWPRVARAAGVLTLALLATVFGVKLMTRTSATAAYQGAVREGARVVDTTVEAAWGSWRAWRVFDRTDTGEVRAWHVDGWTRDVRLRFAHPDLREAPFARESVRQFETARNFSEVHTYAFATLSERPDGHVVFWSDARFCWTPGEDADPQVDVPHQDVRPPASPLRCAMWFGGSLDRDGDPVEALVWLGGHLQRRQP